MTEFKLRLFHGRRTPNETLDNWGFNGPEIGPFEWMHVRYMQTFTFGAPVWDVLRGWAERTGWSRWNDECLEMRAVDEMVHIEKDGHSAYFGDWEIVMCTPTDTPLALWCQADVWWHQHRSTIQVPAVS